MQSCEMSRIWRIYPCKILEGWGKKSEGICSFAKSNMVLGKFEQLKGYSIFNRGLYDKIYGFVPQK